ncbi:hypothetical protein J2T17_005707 [Paenibacillus mucilaginosus]|uniref:hypothetical protein n=1 Tax=Paenibacillus mucilaginosus TaxID=61624 RepID=UPI003D1E6A2C
MNYRFTKLDDDGPAAGTSEIQNSQLETGVGSAQFRGAAIQLFGEPTLKSSQAEGAFLYVVEAVSDHGTSSILTVYEGPGGPAVGGNPETLKVRKLRKYCYISSKQQARPILKRI